MPFVLRSKHTGSRLEKSMSKCRIGKEPLFDNSENPTSTLKEEPLSIKHGGT
jgi:hypothetical protein